MTYHALLEYIRKAKDYGSSDEEITADVCAAGWYQVDARDALELYAKLTTQSAVAVSPERSTPRRSDLHPLVIATLSFAVGFLGYLWLVP